MKDFWKWFVNLPRPIHRSFAVQFAAMIFLPELVIFGVQPTTMSQIILFGLAWFALLALPFIACELWRRKWNAELNVEALETMLKATADGQIQKAFNEFLADNGGQILNKAAEQPDHTKWKQ